MITPESTVLRSSSVPRKPFRRVLPNRGERDEKTHRIEFREIWWRRLWLGQIVVQGHWRRFGDWALGLLHAAQRN